MISVYKSDNKSYIIPFPPTPPGHTLFKYFSITGTVILLINCEMFIFQVLRCKEFKGCHVFPLSCPSIFLQGWLQNCLATWKGSFHCLQAIGGYTYVICKNIAHIFLFIRSKQICKQYMGCDFEQPMTHDYFLRLGKQHPFKLHITLLTKLIVDRVSRRFQERDPEIYDSRYLRSAW